ncbi:hypothetical protein PAMP_011426 [Pampus punctatissimus]
MGELRGQSPKFCRLVRPAGKLGAFVHPKVEEREKSVEGGTTPEVTDIMIMMERICPWSTIPQIIPGQAPSSSASHRRTFEKKGRAFTSTIEVEKRMLLDIFDEKLHPLSKSEVPPDYDKHDPEQKQIYRFVRTLFSAAQLTAECAIVTLVYLERLLTYAEIDICPANWKRIVLGAILLASKVWDDQAVWNVDYCQILKDITVEDMNELERQFLELLQFNINVPSSVYAKYYFDLRSLAEANNLSFPLEPLSRDKAQKLEAISRLCDDKYKDLRKLANKRSVSADNLTVVRWCPAIIS